MTSRRRKAVPLPKPINKQALPPWQGLFSFPTDMLIISKIRPNPAMPSFFIQISRETRLFAISYYLPTGVETNNIHSMILISYIKK